MEIRQLKYFVEICRYKSFSQAASVCFISSQGMSMSMMRLESELGCTLFKRSPKGVVLTPQAEFLLPKAKKILSIADECDTYFHSGSEDTTTLPVAFSHGTIEEFAGDVINQFQQEHPNMKVLVKECPDIECDDAVLNGEYEFALTVGPVNAPNLLSVPLLSSEYAVIVGDDHPLAERKTISIKDLKDLPLAVMKGGLRTFPCLKAACLKAGFEPKIDVFADNILLVFYMATNGTTCGISTMHLFRRLNPPHLRAIPIDSSDFSWDVYAIRKKDSVLSSGADLLWKSLIAHAPSKAKPSFKA